MRQPILILFSMACAATVAVIYFTFYAGEAQSSVPSGKLFSSEELSQHKKTKTEWDEFHLKGRVKSVTKDSGTIHSGYSRNTLTFDRKGRLIKQEQSYFALRSQIATKIYWTKNIYHFNSKGQKTEQIITSSNRWDARNRILYYYNKMENLKKEEACNASGVVTYRILYTYDNHGRKKETSYSFATSDSPLYKTVFSYNNNKLTQMEDVPRESLSMTNKIYTFNAQGRITQEQRFNEYGKHVYEKESKYNKMGDCIFSSAYNYDNKRTTETKSQHKYDSKGNYINIKSTVITYKNDSQETKTVDCNRKIIYFSDK